MRSENDHLWRCAQVKWDGTRDNGHLTWSENRGAGRGIISADNSTVGVGKKNLPESPAAVLTNVLAKLRIPSSGESDFPEQRLKYSADFPLLPTFFSNESSLAISLVHLCTETRLLWTPWKVTVFTWRIHASSYWYGVKLLYPTKWIFSGDSKPASWAEILKNRGIM